MAPLPQHAQDAAAEKEKAEWALQNAAMLRVKADTEAAALDPTGKRSGPFEYSEKESFDKFPS